MNILDFIINRRSIRRYLDKPVPAPVLQDILRAAMYAPSAVNKQPWHFILISNPEVLRSIAAVHPHAAMLHEAKAAIVVCGDLHRAHTPDYAPVDCAAATQNILLAAHALGLGGVWLGVHPREERKQALSELFALPAHIMPFSVVSLGYPVEQPACPERFDAGKIHYEHW